MLKVIGGAVVYGFALYGLNRFVEQMKAAQRGKQTVESIDGGQVAVPEHATAG